MPFASGLPPWHHALHFFADMRPFFAFFREKMAIFLPTAFLQRLFIARPEGYQTDASRWLLLKIETP
jgi:hypothetical protein